MWLMIMLFIFLLVRCGSHWEAHSTGVHELPVRPYLLSLFRLILTHGLSVFAIRSSWSVLDSQSRVVALLNLPSFQHEGTVIHTEASTSMVRASYIMAGCEYHLLQMLFVGAGYQVARTGCPTLVLQLPGLADSGAVHESWRSVWRSSSSSTGREHALAVLCQGRTLCE